MRRVLFALVVVVGCGSPDAAFVDGPQGGMSGSAGGAAGGSASTAGGAGVSTAGSSAVAGSSSKAGETNTAGSGSTAGASGGMSTAGGSMGGNGGVTLAGAGAGGKAPSAGASGSGGSGTNTAKPVGSPCDCYQQTGNKRVFCIPFNNAKGFACTECGPNNLDCDGDTVEALTGSGCEQVGEFCPLTP